MDGMARKSAWTANALLLPGASPVDAETRLANAAAAPGATTVERFARAAINRITA